MSARDELVNVLDLALAKDCNGWQEWLGGAADELIKAGYRQIFDGDHGLSTIKDPAFREAAEAWMRWANLAADDDLGAIGAMQQMLTEFGYQKAKP